MVLLCSLLMMSSVPLAALCTGIVIHKAPSKFLFFLPCYILLFGMLAYAYDPVTTDDLFRYFLQLDYCRKLPFSEAFSWGDDGLVVKNLIFWIIGRIGDNHLLTLLSTGTLYGVSAYIAADAAKGNAKQLKFLILFEILTLPFLEAVSNVRNMSAFALVILAVYRDMVKGKHNVWTFLLYVLPCFIHITGFTLIVIRLAIVVVRRYPVFGTIATVLIPTAALAVNTAFSSVVSRIPGSIGKILTRAVNKAKSTALNSSEYAISRRESGYYNACRAVIFLMFLILIYLTILYIKNNRRIEAKRPYVGFAVFCLLICDLTVVWISIQTVKYWVYAVAAILCCTPILADYLGNFRSQDRKVQICFLGLELLAFMRFGLELYRISAKINPAAFFENILLNNFFVIVGEAVARILA